MRYFYNACDADTHSVLFSVTFCDTSDFIDTIFRFCLELLI